MSKTQTRHDIVREAFKEHFGAAQWNETTNQDGTGSRQLKRSKFGVTNDQISMFKLSLAFKLGADSYEVDVKAIVGTYGAEYIRAKYPNSWFTDRSHYVTDSYKMSHYLPYPEGTEL